MTLNGSSVEHNTAAALSDSASIANNVIAGGGIVVTQGAVTLTNGSSVSNNVAANGVGGGIAVLSGSVSLSGNSQVNGNSARDIGGIMLGSVFPKGAHAVSVTGNSTVNNNSSSAGQRQNPNNLGGGGIAVVSDGDVVIDASQVSGNQTDGMYSGGIVVGIGGVQVTNGSSISGNSNNGPGGGIAANFGGKVEVSGASSVTGNTGGALGGGIVNFSLTQGSVAISGGSEVNGNTLTNAETIGRVVAVFLAVATGGNSSFRDLAVAAGGAGGTALIAGLERLEELAEAAAGPIRDHVRQLTHPLGVLVAGGGIAALVAPVSVTEQSSVSDNIVGFDKLGGHHHIVSLGGGIFQLVGAVTINQGQVEDNQNLHGDGAGIWSGGTLNIVSSTVSGNIAAGNGGGLFNASLGQAAVQQSVFQDNQATFGGAMANRGNLQASQSTVADNSAIKTRRRHLL